MNSCVFVSRLLDVGFSEKSVYLIFEYLDLDLKKHMDSSPKFSEEQHLIKVRYHSLSTYFHMSNSYTNRTYVNLLHMLSLIVVTLVYRAPEILLGSRHYSTPDLAELVPNLEPAGIDLLSVSFPNFS
ncbi:hypothetical protein GW17_00013094 [Ensete ventricosum]|nr:hypothetical protein GW17_00013094 [Ensete ventricosum]